MCCSTGWRTGMASSSTRKPLRVALRETFAGSAKGHGRHVKQSGGHGQFAVCDIEVEPLPAGSGLRVRRQGRRRVRSSPVHPQRREGGSRPDGARRQRWLPGRRPSGDPHRRQGALGRLVRHGVPDGRCACPSGRRVPDAGRDARTRGRDRRPRGRCIRRLHHERPVGASWPRASGTEPVGHGRTLVRAEVPQLEIMRYAIDLRSMSHGAGTFTRSYQRHQPMPPNLVADLTQTRLG